MRGYRWCWLIGVCLLIVALCGCAQAASVMKWLFGYDDDGNVSPTSPGAIGSAIANYIVPGLGTAITALGGLYGHAAYKNGKRKRALKATFETIEEHGDLPKEELKKKLAHAHKSAGVELLAKGHAKEVSKKPAIT